MNSPDPPGLEPGEMFSEHIIKDGLSYLQLTYVIQLPPQKE